MANITLGRRAEVVGCSDYELMGDDVVLPTLTNVDADDARLIDNEVRKIFAKYRNLDLIQSDQAVMDYYNKIQRIAADRPGFASNIRTKAILGFLETLMDKMQKMGTASAEDKKYAARDAAIAELKVVMGDVNKLLAQTPTDDVMAALYQLRDKLAYIGNPFSPQLDNVWNPSYTKISTALGQYAQAKEDARVAAEAKAKADAEAAAQAQAQAAADAAAAAAAAANQGGGGGGSGGSDYSGGDAGGDAGGEKKGSLLIPLALGLTAAYFAFK